MPHTLRAGIHTAILAWRLATGDHQLVWGSMIHLSLTNSDWETGRPFLNRWRLENGNFCTDNKIFASV